MLVAVASRGPGPEARVSPVLGRCEVFVLHDTGSGDFESHPNPARDESGGAGVRAAEFLAGLGTNRLIGMNFGPKAFSVLEAAGIGCYLCPGEVSVREAVALLEKGELERISGATTGSHFGSAHGAGR